MTGLPTSWGIGFTITGLPATWGREFKITGLAEAKAAPATSAGVRRQRRTFNVIEVIAALLPRFKLSSKIVPQKSYRFYNKSNFLVKRCVFFHSSAQIEPLRSSVNRPNFTSASLGNWPRSGYLDRERILLQPEDNP
jgi:hypothetical protein